MADLKMTLSDSEEEQEKLKAPAQESTKKQKKREQKLKGKKDEDEDNEPLALDSNFNLIDDSIRKDVSKISRKREYDASKQEGTSWKYQSAVKEDVNLNKVEDIVASLKTKIIELRREVDLNEFDKGLEEIYKKYVKDRPSNEDNKDNNEKNKTPANKIGAHAKIHYEKDDLISFNDLFLSRPLVKACNSLEYDHPTRIQSQVIPNILENRDLLVNAVTGSGKTASYLLPILEKLHRRDLRTSRVSDGKISKTRVLIFHPTRELAAQCSSMLEYLNKFIFPKITYATIIGGSSQRKQEIELLDSPDIVIATPGRLLDIIMNSKSIHFNNIEIVVLDEADKLLEMGFQDMIEELMKNVKRDSDVSNIQTLLFSATLSKDIKRLASLTLKNPQMISEAKQQNSVNAYIKLAQYMIKVPNIDEVSIAGKTKKKRKGSSDSSSSFDPNNMSSDSSSESYGDGLSDEEDEEYQKKKEERKKKKEESIKSKKEEKEKTSENINDKNKVHRIREAIVLSLVFKTYTKKTIIFLNKKSECHRLFLLFTFFGLKAAEVHGNLTQKQRMESVEKFQSGEVDFLLATDLLARGIDIYNVQAVINFNFPNEENRYVHRVGRTARAGNAGTAISLCDENERQLVKKASHKCKGNAKMYSYSKELKNTIYTLINLLDEPITKILHQEKEEFQIKRAELEIRKAQNIIDYKEEIYNRPKKEWFQTKKQANETNKKEKMSIEDFRNKAIKKKLKMIEKIKDKKKQLRDQEHKQMKFEKRVKRRQKRGVMYRMKRDVHGRVDTHGQGKHSLLKFDL